MPTCRSCPAAILWATTEKGRSMPVDAEPDPDGNVEITYDDAGRAHAVVHGQPPMVTAGKLHMPHFATCPKADEWRPR
jgi:hypothetical protein